MGGEHGEQLPEQEEEGGVVELAAGAPSGLQGWSCPGFLAPCRLPPSITSISVSETKAGEAQLCGPVDTNAHLVLTR